MIIAAAKLETKRLSTIRPFHFKGSSWREKWLTRVTLTTESGLQVQAQGSQAVLWSDADFFLAFSEEEGNQRQAAITEAVLKTLIDQLLGQPLEMLPTLIATAKDLAPQVTGRAVSPTLILNALVPIDNALWKLYAAEQGISSLEELLPTPQAGWQRRLHRVPVINATMADDEILQLANEHHCLKLKLGLPGEPTEMLATDRELLGQVLDMTHNLQKPGAPGGHLQLYLDLNGRYPDVDTVQRLLADFPTKRICAVEEPLPYESNESVAELPVPAAADESLVDVAGVAAKADQGYRIMTLKPAGKTFSMALLQAAAARKRGLAFMVADNAAVPIVRNWNMALAAWCPPLPGWDAPLLESNGPQFYADWVALCAAYPQPSATWLQPYEGCFLLDNTYYAAAGGVLAREEPW